MASIKKGNLWKATTDSQYREAAESDVTTRDVMEGARARARDAFDQYPVMSLAAAFGLGCLTGYLLKPRFSPISDEGNASLPDPRSWEGKLRDGGARNEVIGGHPEDMNGMPPPTDMSAEAPVYDGSDLAEARRLGAGNWPRHTL